MREPGWGRRRSAVVCQSLHQTFQAGSTYMGRQRIRMKGGRKDGRNEHAMCMGARYIRTYIHTYIHERGKGGEGTGAKRTKGTKRKGTERRQHTFCGLPRSQGNARGRTPPPTARHRKWYSLDVSLQVGQKSVVQGQWSTVVPVEANSLESVASSSQQPSVASSSQKPARSSQWPVVIHHFVTSMVGGSGRQQSVFISSHSSRVAMPAASRVAI